MESFVHLRKGRTPKRLHADLDGLKDDEMNFLPKPAESVPGTERTPWYHRNVDYDEIALFHGGSLYGIPMPPGLISHAPQGVHHGAPEKARERARRKFDEHSRVDWQVIAVDTRRRLTASAEVLANDLGQH
jgi:homogentisate 1,2-dioxygenase